MPLFKPGRGNIECTGFQPVGDCTEAFGSRSPIGRFAHVHLDHWFQGFEVRKHGLLAQNQPKLVKYWTDIPGVLETKYSVDTRPKAFHDNR